MIFVFVFSPIFKKKKKRCLSKSFNSKFLMLLLSKEFYCFSYSTIRGGARNFGLRGPSCDANILVKTNLYTHTCI